MATRALSSAVALLSPSACSCRPSASSLSSSLSINRVSLLPPAHFYTSSHPWFFSTSPLFSSAASLRLSSTFLFSPLSPLSALYSFPTLHCPSSSYSPSSFASFSSSSSSYGATASSTLEPHQVEKTVIEDLDNRLQFLAKNWTQRRLPELQRIETEISEIGEHLSAAQIGRVFYALSHIPSSSYQPSASCLQMLEKQTQQLLTSMTLLQLSTVLVALAKFAQHFQPSTALLKSLVGRVELLLPEMQPFDLAHTYNFLAKFPHFAAPRPLLAALQERTLALVEAFDAQGMALCLYGFSKLNHQFTPSQHYFETMEQGSFKLLPHSRAQELATSLLAFCNWSAHYRPSASYLDALEQASLRIISTFNSQDVANSVYAISFFEPRLDFLQALHDHALSIMGTFTAQSVANTLHGLAACPTFQPSKAFLQAAERQLLDRLATVNLKDKPKLPQHLSKALLDIRTCLRAFIRFSYLEASGPFLDVAQQALVTQMAQQDDAGVAGDLKTLTGFADFVPSAALLLAFEQEATKRMPKFAVPALLANLSGFAHYPQHPLSKDYLDALSAQLKLQLPNLTPRSVASAVNVLAKLPAATQAEPSLLQLLHQRALECINSFDCVSLALMLKGFSKWPHFRPSEQLLMAVESQAITHTGELDVSHLASLLQSFSWNVDHYHPSVIFLLAMEKRTLDLAATLTARDITACLNAMCKFNEFRPSQSYLKALEQQALQQRAEFTPRYIVSCIEALAVFHQFRLSPQFGQAFEALILSHLSSFTAEQIETLHKSLSTSLSYLSQLLPGALSHYLQERTS